MKGTPRTIQSKAYDFPDILREIPDPPAQLYVISNNWPALLDAPRLAIVGSRKPTTYGQTVTYSLASRLVQAGACIVSGLAYGVDVAAHRAALEQKGLTIAVLAGGLDSIYPSHHQRLAQQIIDQGGALISEYPPGTAHHKLHFIARNRLVSGLSRAVLITEASEKSGTWHTVRFALEQGREVLAVPGNITSPLSIGPNRLISSGAHPVLSETDILQVMSLQPVKAALTLGETPEEQLLLDLLNTGVITTASLLKQSQLDVATFNQTLTMLELTGKVRGLGNNQWTLA
jgi:DNA processing protein